MVTTTKLKATSPASPPNPATLEEALAALRTRRQQLALEAEQGDQAALGEIERVEARLADVQRLIERRELAGLEREARARAEAAAQRTARRRALVAQIQALVVEEGTLVAAIETGYAALADAVQAVLAQRRAIYAAVCEVRALDGREPGGGDQKLVAREAVSHWLLFRLARLLSPWIDSPSARFWAKPLGEVLARPRLGDEEGPS